MSYCDARQCLQWDTSPLAQEQECISRLLVGELVAEDSGTGVLAQ